MFLLLDSGVLGRLCHTSRTQYLPLQERLRSFRLLDREHNKIFVSDVADYEVRRKLLQLIDKQQAVPRAIDRLNEVLVRSEYVPIDTDTMHLAARLWADARRRGRPTASDDSLDTDVILAAQAKTIGATVVTTNHKHLSQFVPTIDWTEIPTTV